MKMKKMKSLTDGAACGCPVCAAARLADEAEAVARAARKAADKALSDASTPWPPEVMAWVGRFVLRFAPAVEPNTYYVFERPIAVPRRPEKYVAHISCPTADADSLLAAFRDQCPSRWAVPADGPDGAMGGWAG